VNGGDRRNIAPGTASTQRFVLWAVMTCIVTVVAVCVVAFSQSPNALQIIATIIGVTTPVTLGLLGAGLNGMSTSIDGRMTQLLQATAEKERVKGQLDGLVANPNTNITEEVIRRSAGE
jgi:hypothetical protein